MLDLRDRKLPRGLVAAGRLTPRVFHVKQLADPDPLALALAPQGGPQLGFVTSRYAHQKILWLCLSLFHVKHLLVSALSLT